MFNFKRKTDNTPKFPDDKLSEGQKKYKFKKETLEDDIDNQYGIESKDIQRLKSIIKRVEKEENRRMSLRNDKTV